MIRFIFPLLFLFFSSFSFAEEIQIPDKIVECHIGGTCRTAYSDAGTSIKLARGAGHFFCGSNSYDACSGITHYCGQKLSASSQAPSTVGVFVHARWSAYQLWDLDKKQWLTCTLDFQGGEGDLTPEYNKPPTDEICLSRPVLDGMTFPGVYKGDDGTRYVNVQGCIYEATGNPFICNPDDDTVCTANWKPVAVDPAFSDDKEDGGSSGGGSSGGGSSGGGSSGGGSSGGGSSGGGNSGGGSSGGGSSGGGSSGGGSSGGGNSGGGSSGGGNSGGGSSSGDGWLGDILGWLQRIWVSVNDLNNAFSVSQADMNNALNSLDNGIKDINQNIASSLPDGDFPLGELSHYLPGQGSESHDNNNWLTVNIDKLVNTNNGIALPFTLQFSFNLPLIGSINFKIDTSHFAKAYDDYVRSVLEYAIYMITMLRVFVISRRTLFEREVKL
ncbi:Phage Coat Protein A [Escherichia coli]|uniref:hypothetical protein n=2 Tax=Escherichia coli TaxID=562 RepID=UPI0006A0EEB3|nr:hypothetical protein [Escherichia coli]CTV49398.1 Phage Coat Protein A [Escherichia coli]CTZ96510.1 Phage Coat Protein A [Escherichia coli]HCN9115477.1 hypothetical protein [Escherichia coli]